MIRPGTLPEVMAYIREHWTPGHPVGRDETFARFWFQTPWVDTSVFPTGVSCLVAEGDGISGISCAMVTPTAGWHMIWHVKERGTGQGMALIRAMIEALKPKPMHVFGISTLGRPVYEKLGFQLRDATRFRLGPSPHESHMNEVAVDPDWLRYRYDEHPLLAYQRRGDTIVRSDANKWGHVLHVARLGVNWPEALSGEERFHDLVQAWSFDHPGPGWFIPSERLPTVFHPVQARGNTLLVAGSPALPAEIHGSDGGQDRPPCA